MRTLENTCLPGPSCFVIQVVTCPFPSSGHLKGTCAINDVERSKELFLVSCAVIVKYENVSVHSSSCYPKFGAFQTFPW